MSILTQCQLQEILSYSPESGNFVWLIQYGRAHPGKIAGTIGKEGYVAIKIERKLYKAHRLAWLYMIGEWPSGRLDHKDNCQSNNRWDNIRLASHSQNMANRKLNKNSNSGFKGVSFHKKSGRYIAYVNKDGRRHYRGSYITAEEASKVSIAMAKDLHGEFARSH